MPILTGIITISDRASRGEYEDLSGPALKQAVLGYGWSVQAETVVPDEKAAIQLAIRDQMARGCELILTTGGTGVGRRDVTPEAVRDIGSIELPGFGEVMRAGSMKLTPHAILSRALAVVVEHALIVCLPGKPNGAVECLGFVAGAIPHCTALLQSTLTDCPDRGGEEGSRKQAAKGHDCA